MNKPSLRRDIQPVGTVIQGRQMIAFHDPYQLSENSIAIDIRSLPLLQLLDGSHDLRDIQFKLMKYQGGRMVYLSEIESFIELLDRAYLLQNESFEKKLNDLKREFYAQRTRQPSHAGKSYPADPQLLSQSIQDAEKNFEDISSVDVPSDIAGIVAPHIDIKTAHRVYINTYRHLRGKRYDRVIILGINHYPQEGFYSVTEKNYLTPFGEIKTDVSFISELRQRLPEGTLTPDDFGHKIEHSIEFQTIFLQYYLGDTFTIVPILCGSIHEYIHQKKDIFSDSHFCSMVSALRDLMGEERSRTLLVAGVDLSHIGRKFGDQQPADFLLPHARVNDRRILTSLEHGEPEEVYRNALETQDRYRICGLHAILVLGTILKGSRGTLLHWETYDEQITGSAVTYASLLFPPV